MRQRILSLSFSPLHTDPRVRRQIAALHGRYDITAAGFTDPAIPGVEFVRIPTGARTLAGKAFAAALLRLGQFERFYWSSENVRAALAALAGREYDMIVANDVATLPLALRLQSRHGVIVDAHEYSPREFEDSFFWRFFFRQYTDYLCRTYLRRAAGMITVCQSIADEYRANFGVNARVLRNSAPFRDLAPGACRPGVIRLIHHGGAARSRKIELMIDAIAMLDERFHLDLMLVPTDPGYLEELAALAGRHPRVRIVPPVSLDEIPERLNEYDVGLYLLAPTNFNNRFALPNKLFEFIQARLAVAIGPSPEMARLVERYDCGVVAEDFTPRALAACLRTLTPQRIERFRRQSHAAARELSYERDSSTLLEMVGALTGSG